MRVAFGRAFQSLPSCAFDSVPNATKLQITSAVQFLCNSTLRHCQIAAAIAGPRLMNRAQRHREAHFEEEW